MYCTVVTCTETNGSVQTLLVTCTETNGSVLSSSDMYWD